METNPHNLANLFLQLGLPDEVDTFVATHQLPTGIKLSDAPFWSEAQATFLKQALINDSDWCGAVDALAVRLARPP